MLGDLWRCRCFTFSMQSRKAWLPAAHEHSCQESLRPDRSQRCHWGGPTRRWSWVAERSSMELPRWTCVVDMSQLDEVSYCSAQLLDNVINLWGWRDITEDSAGSCPVWETRLLRWAFVVCRQSAGRSPVRLFCCACRLKVKHLHFHKSPSISWIYPNITKTK